MRRNVLLVWSLCLVWHSFANAETRTLSWTPNTEPDLKEYRVYQRKVQDAYAGPVATIPAPTTQTTVTMPDGSQEWRFAVTAVDAATNESAKSTEVPWLVAQVANPDVPVLTVRSDTPTSLVITYTVVNDGTGNPAQVDVRHWRPPGSWGPSPTTVCSGLFCRISGLLPDTVYDVQGVAYRGVSNLSATFGALSAVTTVRTLAVVPPVVPPIIPPVIPPVVPPTMSKTITITKETTVQHTDKLMLDVLKANCPGGSTTTSKTYNAAGAVVPAGDPTWTKKVVTITCK